MGCKIFTPDTLQAQHGALVDPWDAAVGKKNVILAILVATQGPAYREIGAAMSIFADGRIAGSITSGCIEADLVLHALRMQADSAPLRLRYGIGSPFFDLPLPCGGGIDVLLFPLRDPDILIELTSLRRRRRRIMLLLDEQRGRLGITRVDAPLPPYHLSIPFLPPIRNLIFGVGAEALAFAALSRAANYQTLLLSHDQRTRDLASCATCALHDLEQLKCLEADPDTAAILFYHDHDYELPLLHRLLQLPLFYIGAQGSRATQRKRLAKLEAIAAQQIHRLRGPIGLFPSSRNPHDLAVSVLAEIAQCHHFKRSNISPLHTSR